MMGKGRSLELYFVDGKPDGMLTAEVFNWTGHVLKTPRTRIVDALKRPEAKYTGVYILLGDIDGQPTAYIGEAEDLSTRLRGHVAQKDWWEEAVLITASADNLHKAHVKYLESRLVEMALATKHMPLENGNQPPRSSLSESGTANMESFLDTLMMVLPAIQVGLFVDKRDAPVSQNPTTRNAPEFELSTPKNSVKATALLLNGEMVVQKGSVARSDWPRKQGQNQGYRRLHQDLIHNGILAVSGKLASFTSNYAFGSPSAAAAILNGRASNGRKEWKLKGTNKTYADWEAEQLMKEDP